MTLEIIGGLALTGLLIGVPLWFRSRPKREISWPPVTRSKERARPAFAQPLNFKQPAYMLGGWAPVALNMIAAAVRQM
jgi:hypothetical protein